MAELEQRLDRLAKRLLNAPATPTGIHPDWTPDRPYERPPIPAAVLIALVERPGGLKVLYTERSTDLRSHSGQVAFPGGKIDSSDHNPAYAALREASEEVALDPANAQIIGYLPDYLTGTNYLITPVVAHVSQDADFRANPREVESLFEVPLAFIADPANFSTFMIRRGDREHTTWRIDHGGHVIWGITANLTRAFFDLALAGDAQ